MDLWSSHKRAGSTTALDQALAFEAGQRLPRGHQTDFVQAGEFALRRYRIAREEFGRLDALADGILDTFINWRAVVRHTQSVSEYLRDERAAINLTGAKVSWQCQAGAVS